MRAYVLPPKPLLFPNGACTLPIWNRNWHQRPGELRGRARLLLFPGAGSGDYDTADASMTRPMRIGGPSTTFGVVVCNVDMYSHPLQVYPSDHLGRRHGGPGGVGQVCAPQGWPGCAKRTGRIRVGSVISWRRAFSSGLERWGLLAVSAQTGGVSS